jgi:hypothetical protein
MYHPISINRSPVANKQAPEIYVIKKNLIPASFEEGSSLSFSFRSLIVEPLYHGIESLESRAGMVFTARSKRPNSAHPIEPYINPFSIATNDSYLNRKRTVSITIADMK